jgi:hypothetical protein
MKRRVALHLAGLLVVVVGALIAPVAVGAAYASTGGQQADVSAVTPNADNSCLQIGVTKQVGSYITGYGSISCGSGATLEIQRSRWYGWETMASAAVNGTGHDQSIRYYCYNTGTHTFRTIIWAYNLAGSYIMKASNQITVSC